MAGAPGARRRGQLSCRTRNVGSVRMATRREESEAGTDAAAGTDATARDPALLVFSQESADAPHDAYRQLREGCPVARSNFAGSPAVYLSRYDDVLWALRHPEIFSSDVDALSI